MNNTKKYEWLLPAFIASYFVLVVLSITLCNIYPGYFKLINVSCGILITFITLYGISVESGRDKR